MERVKPPETVTSPCHPLHFFEFEGEYLCFLPEDLRESAGFFVVGFVLRENQQFGDVLVFEMDEEGINEPSGFVPLFLQKPHITASINAIPKDPIRLSITARPKRGFAFLKRIGMKPLEKVNKPEASPHSKGRPLFI